MNGRAWTQIQVSDFKPHILILDLPDKGPRIIGKRMLCAFPHMPSPLWAWLRNPESRLGVEADTASGKR